MSQSTANKCVSCGAALSAGARFCHACGAAQRPAGARQLPLVWVFGAASVLLVVVAIAAYSVGRASAGGAARTAGAPAASGGAPPDISSMTPLEQADRLFELVMTAHEQGDMARVNQFLPMAFQAYANLGTLNADQHYHIGLMNAISGHAADALARVDSIRATQPNHLLATMLRHSVAQLQGDSTAASAALRKFSGDYDAEMAKNLIEYQLHGNSLDAFREQARRAPGGG